MPLLYNNPEHWRKRADECRELARMMMDREGKSAMQAIADKYDELAKRWSAWPAILVFLPGLRTRLLLRNLLKRPV